MNYTECDAPKCTNRKRTRDRWWKLTPVIDQTYWATNYSTTDPTERDYCSLECVKAGIEEDLGKSAVAWL